MSPKPVVKHRNMAVVSSVFGTKFSQKELKIIPMSSDKRLPSKFNCGFAGSSSPWNSQQREKYTSTLGLPLLPKKKNEMKGNRPYILAALPHIFAIFSSQISTMMETLDAILKHELTNRRCLIYPRYIRFQSSLLLSMPLHFFPETDFTSYDLPIVQKGTKTERGKLKKFQDFCPRDMESCLLASERCVELLPLNLNFSLRNLTS